MDFRRWKTDWQELDYGPNGGLVFAMEYLSENMNWLEESLIFVFENCSNNFGESEIQHSLAWRERGQPFQI